MSESFIKLHCFIDYENVHESGFEGVEMLSDGDAVTIFISSPSHKISLVILETLIRKKCELTIIHTIGTGKNNLDFQLVAELGYQIGQHKIEERAFAIISKDRGFENVVSAFANRGVRIEQCETVEKISRASHSDDLSEQAPKEEDDWGFAKTIRESLSALNLSKADESRVERIFRESTTLAMLHDRLAKAYGKKGNHQLYSKLKILHKRYQKTLPEPENRPEEMLEEARFEAESIISHRDSMNAHSLESGVMRLPSDSGNGIALSNTVVSEDAVKEKRPTRRERKNRNGTKKAGVEKTIENQEPDGQAGASKGSSDIVSGTAVSNAIGARIGFETEENSESSLGITSVKKQNQVEPTDTSTPIKKSGRRPGRPRKQSDKNNEKDLDKSNRPLVSDET